MSATPDVRARAEAIVDRAFAPLAVAITRAQAVFETLDEESAATVIAMLKVAMAEGLAGDAARSLIARLRRESRARAATTQTPPARLR